MKNVKGTKNISTHTISLAKPGALHTETSSKAVWPKF